MGTDHGIVVGWGYRIPLSLWISYRRDTRRKWVDKYNEKMRRKRAKNAKKAKRLKTDPCAQDDGENAEDYPQVNQVDEEADQANHDSQTVFALSSSESLESEASADAEYLSFNEEDDYAEYDVDFETGFYHLGEQHNFYSQEPTMDIGDSADNAYIFICHPTYEFESLSLQKVGGALAWSIRGPYEHMQNVSNLNFSVRLEVENVDYVTDEEWKGAREEFDKSLPPVVKNFLNQHPNHTFYNRWIFGCAQ